MRKWFALLALAAVAASCSTSDQRPEGIVERWIVSMNQGVAGEPWRWADDDATARVSPTWDTNEPGSIDSFSLGSARAEGDGFVVPFTLERTDGRVASGDAVVAWRSLEGEASELVVEQVRLGVPTGETGRWQEAAPAAAWPIALLTGVVPTGVSVADVRQVRKRPA